MSNVVGGGGKQAISGRRVGTRSVQGVPLNFIYSSSLNVMIRTTFYNTVNTTRYFLIAL